MESGAAHLGCSRPDLKHRRYHLLHLPPASAQHIHKLPIQVAWNNVVKTIMNHPFANGEWCCTPGLFWS